MGGTQDYEGRVEIYHNGEWGTVCDDGFDRQDARVVCRQLGYHSGGTALTDNEYGSGTGQIWLDDLACNGSEEQLSDCNSPDWGTHNCGHYEDAGVRCSN